MIPALKIHANMRQYATCTHISTTLKSNEKNSLKIWFSSCMHCSGLRRLQVSSIMQHCALLVSIKDSILSAVHVFMSHPVPKLCPIVSKRSLIFSRSHHVNYIMCIFISSRELLPQLAHKCYIFSSGLKGKCSTLTHSLFQMWNCSDFSTQASN